MMPDCGPRRVTRAERFFDLRVAPTTLYGTSDEVLAEPWPGRTLPRGVPPDVLRRKQ